MRPFPISKRYFIRLHMPATEHHLIATISQLSKATDLAAVRGLLMQIAQMLQVDRLDLMVEYWAVSGEARRLWFSNIDDGRSSVVNVPDIDFIFGAGSRQELTQAEPSESARQGPSTDFQTFDLPEGVRVKTRQVMEFPAGVGLPHRLVLSLTQEDGSASTQAALTNASRLILAASRISLMRIFKAALEHVKDQTLTPRELECLKWAALGKTGADTAKILTVSEATVAFHLKNAISKMHAASKAHAVALALSRGWIDLRGFH